MANTIDGPGQWKTWQITAFSFGALLLSACVLYMAGAFLEWWSVRSTVALIFVPVSLVGYFLLWLPLGCRYGYYP